MTLRSPDARVGAVAFDGLVELFSDAANNRFEENTYRVLDPNDAYWTWNGQALTWDQWRSFGHDLNGKIEAVA